MTKGSDGPIECLENFKHGEDPHQPAKVLDPLDDILRWCGYAVIRGADGGVGVALNGQERREFLRRFLPFPHRAPSHDQLGMVWARLDVALFPRGFMAWVERVTESVHGVVVIDGKTLRRSWNRAAGQGPIPRISAGRDPQRLVLGQPQAAGKSHAITAIPKWREWGEWEGAVVTRDARGGPRTLASPIVEQGRMTWWGGKAIRGGGTKRWGGGRTTAKRARRGRRGRSRRDMGRTTGAGKPIGGSRPSPSRNGGSAPMGRGCGASPKGRASGSTRRGK